MSERFRAQWQMVSESDSFSCWLLGWPGGEKERIIINNPKNTRRGYSVEKEETRIVKYLHHRIQPPSGEPNKNAETS